MTEIKEMEREKSEFIKNTPPCRNKDGREKK